MDNNTNGGIHPSWIGGNYPQMYFGVQVEDNGVVALVYLLYPELHELTYNGHTWGSTFYYPIPSEDLAIMALPHSSSSEEVMGVHARIDQAWEAWKKEARASLIQALG